MKLKILKLQIRFKIYSTIGSDLMNCFENIFRIPFARSNYFYPLKKKKSANSSFPLKHFSLFSFWKYSVYMILHIVCTRCKLAITCYVVIRIANSAETRFISRPFHAGFSAMRCLHSILSHCSSNYFYLFAYCFALALRFSFALHLLTSYANHHRSSSIRSSLEKTGFIFTSIIRRPRRYLSML